MNKEETVRSEAEMHSQPVSGEAWQIDLESGATLAMVAVEKGEYQRGSRRFFAGEKPLHTVVVSHTFWIARHLLTQAQYQAVAGSNPAHFPGAERPVEMVNWYEAVEWCRRLTEREKDKDRLPEGFVYRLPTEGEWEYAARGGQAGRGCKYAGSNRVDEVAWYGGGMGGNSDFMTSPVGMKQANELGLYDMSGNVWEWCHDWQEDYPPFQQLVDPVGPLQGSHRVLRGGSWGYEPRHCLITRRDGLTPGHRYCDVGFRPVLAPELSRLRARPPRHPSRL